MHIHPDTLIIHDGRLSTLWLKNQKSNPLLYKKFKKPNNLSIYTSHNYPKVPVLEECLEYLGIEGCKVDKLNVTKWSNTLRLREFVKYLKNECATEYILFCDADDVVICKDPKLIVDHFLKTGADLLYASTSYPNGYLNMPDVKKWADRIHKGRYLNAGVFIGKRDFVLNVYQRVLDYVTDGDGHTMEFYNNELKFFSGFPLGIGSDQAILRYLEPEFYPRMQIDHSNILFFRNNNRSFIHELYLKTKKKIYKLLK